MSFGKPEFVMFRCDQSPLVGAGVEVINGGHGIKNPLLQNNVLTQLVNAQQLGKQASSFLFYLHFIICCHCVILLCIYVCTYVLLRA